MFFFKRYFADFYYKGQNRGVERMRQNKMKEAQQYVFDCCERRRDAAKYRSFQKKKCELVGFFIYHVPSRLLKEDGGGCKMKKIEKLLSRLPTAYRWTEKIY